MNDADDLHMGRPKAPWHTRAIGFVLLAFGLLNGLGFLLLPPDQWGTSREIAFNVVGTLLVLVAGAGVVMSRRWGWLLALVAALTLLVTGLIAFLQPGDIAFPGANLVALVLLVLPSAVMLTSLLSPAALRWVRRRDSRTVASGDIPARPDSLV